METGTGKTYVYLRTIFELNKRYGFTKFVIVVPSIAIKEGVYKSLQMTDGHFRALYSGTPFEYYLYDSNKLTQVRNFATSSQIQIMVVTVGAINKKNVNNLYKDSEKTGGEKPIALVKATRPILIVDEPQSVDGGLRGQGRKALEEMNPLCTLRYSATHRDVHHMVYRLDAVDAYERKLVKQIEVASATIEDAYNQPYVRLRATTSSRGEVSATIEVDVQAKGGKVRRAVRKVYDGDDLEQVTGRAVYQNCRVGEIRVGTGSAFIELQVPGDHLFLSVNDTWGDIDPAVIQRQMIRRTICEHFEKEIRLRQQGIKVLSLFFVDAVEKYRCYDEAGKQVKGEYAQLFEEEYERLAKHPDYQSLFSGVDPKSEAERVHGGYFSIDRKQRWTDTNESNQIGRENSQRAYQLIMKDKERLLSLEEPLKFIFSHSALREGWDNPNVFQICALRDIRTEQERRQTIGRGLRLCVNNQGERIRGFEVNTLTVIARESYEEFAEKLQREIEADTGVRFGLLAPNQFAEMAIEASGDETQRFGADNSKILFEHLLARSYVDANGYVQNSLRNAIRDNKIDIPYRFGEQRKDILAVLRKVVGRVEVRNADERQTVRPRQRILDSPEFRALWDRIKHKTTYRLEFDNDVLIEDCTEALKNMPRVPVARLLWRKADIGIGRAGVDSTEISTTPPVSVDEGIVQLPDILTELQNRTNLTRRSLQKILKGSGRLADFTRNPQRFIEIAARSIELCKRQAVVDGIKYQRIGDECYYAQHLFEQAELTGYLRNMVEGSKSLFEKTVYESKVEANFADQLEKNIAIKLYAKLPGWFKVPTPLGSYNPDWAVLVNSESGERLYLVVETKGTTFSEELRPVEGLKIKCGEAHFREIAVQEQPAKYEVATNVEQLLANVR